MEPPTTAAADSPNARDNHLIELVRQGHLSAFDELYRRHKNAAVYVARREADNLSDVDDVVAEAFLAVLVALEAGKGPNAYFRSYVLTTTRRMAHQRNAGARRRAAFDRDRRSRKQARRQTLSSHCSNQPPCCGPSARSPPDGNGCCGAWTLRG